MSINIVAAFRSSIPKNMLGNLLERSHNIMPHDNEPIAFIVVNVSINPLELVEQSRIRVETEIYLHSKCLLST